MSTTPTSALPRTATEASAAYAVRGRRQKIAVLAGATLLGVWLGTSAPNVSPAATPVAPAAPTAVVQNPAAADPGLLDRPGRFGAGRAR
jgi:hypothetical protein